MSDSVRTFKVKIRAEVNWSPVYTTWEWGTVAEGLTLTAARLLVEELEEQGFEKDDIKIV